MNILILFVLIGLTTGLLASVLREEGRLGVLGDITVGVLGAVLGGYLLRFVNSDGEGLLGSMAAAAMGAALLVFDLRLLRRSFAEQLIRRVIWRRGSSPVKCGLLQSSPLESERSICPVCGQRHLP